MQGIQSKSRENSQTNIYNIKQNYAEDIIIEEALSPKTNKKKKLNKKEFMNQSFRTSIPTKFQMDKLNLNKAISPNVNHQPSLSLKPDAVKNDQNGQNQLKSRQNNLISDTD